MVKIGFVIESVSSLKVFGSLIKEARNFNFEPFIFISKSGGGKEYDIISSGLLKQYFPKVFVEDIICYGDTSIVEIARAKQIKAIVFVNPYNKFHQDIVELAKADIKTYGLDYFVNSIYTAARGAYEKEILSTLENITERLTISDYFQKMEFEVMPAIEQFQKKFCPVGMSVVDAYKYIDKEKVKKILGLPEDKKIFTFFTPNIRKNDLWPLYGLFAKNRIKRIVKFFRRICDENNWSLVIKSREKQWDSYLYRRYSDLFVYDPIPFPHTSALLLSVSEIMAHWGSMSVFEASAVSVPSLGIKVEAIDKLHHYMQPRPREAIKQAMFVNKPDSPFNFKGVSESISLDVDFNGLKAVCERLAGKKDKNAFSLYNKKFIATDKYNVYEKIFSRIA